MTLIGHRVTQYMYVLFDNVHIYIQKSQFTLASYVQYCFDSKTSGDFAEILIININKRVLFTELKIDFSLMQPLCQIKKKD